MNGSKSNVKFNDSKTNVAYEEDISLQPINVQSSQPTIANSVASNDSNNNSDDEERSTTTKGSEEEFANPCFITVETDEGEFKKYMVDMQDDSFTVNANLFNAQRRSSILPSGMETFIHGAKKRHHSIGEGTENLEPDLVKELQKKAKRRLVAKGGHINTRLKNVPKKGNAYFKDIFTTAIDMPWRYTIFAFTLSFFLSWTIFAGVWYLIAYLHGDFMEDNLPNGVNQLTGNFTPCVTNNYNFASSYLFSVETQHTIGYGGRMVTEECPHSIILMSIQSVIGVLFSSCMAGVVFAKLARPKARIHTVMFSKNAVISLRNGQLCLIFRIGNLRRSQLIEAHVRVNIIHERRVTNEGEKYTYSQQQLEITTMEEDEVDSTMMILPTSVYHKIDEKSPFYYMTPKDVLQSKFEIVVAFEGIVEATGNSVQARTSYLPREILWGYRFENMVSYSTKLGTYMVDVSYLNAVVEDETPSEAMNILDQKRMAEERFNRRLSSTHNSGRFITSRVKDRVESVPELKEE